MSRSIRTPFALSVLVAACSSLGPTATSPAATPETSSPATTAPGSPAIETAAPPTILPTPSTFTSTLYGYSLTLPAGWHSGPAILRWDGASAPGNEDPTVDKFGGPVSASAFMFAAPTSASLERLVQDTIKWTVRDHGDTCPARTPEVTEPVPFGDAKGTFMAWDCGILINSAVAVHDGMAYTLVVRDLAVHGATDAADRALLDELLDSVVFRS